ncbi:MAG: sugar phosphate isomerase/epimerase family protein [Pirellulales bacterium]
MRHLPTRRQFVTSSLLGAVGAATLNARPAHAIEPIARPQGHKFKLSLAAYSYRDLLQGRPPQLTLVDFIDDCAKFGLAGTELTSYYFPDDPSPEFLRQMKGEAFRRGLDISGTAVGNDFCHPRGEERDTQIASVKQWIERADAMDAPVIRIFSGNVKRDQNPQDAHRLAVEAIEECCAHAGKFGVFLALENHGGLTSEVDGMLRIVRDVQSPWFGVNMDTGNFHSEDIYGDLAKLAPYSLNVQVKVAVRTAGQRQQPTDFKRLAEMLRTSGYRGYVVLEFEEAGNPREECPRYIEQMREAFV